MNRSSWYERWDIPLAIALSVGAVAIMLWFVLQISFLWT